MVSEEEGQTHINLKKPIAEHERVKSFNLDIDKAKSTPLSMWSK